MQTVRRLLAQTVTAITFAAGVAPCFATWHPTIEGEYFSDFDAVGAPSSFAVYPAGIYEPADLFVGSVNWSDDRSDTIVLQLIDAPLGYVYKVPDFRAWFSVESALNDSQGITFTMVALGRSDPPLFSVDLHTAIGSKAGSFNFPLDIVSGQLYALTLHAHGDSNGLLSARYGLGFTVVQAVPEPSTMLLLGFGLPAFAWAVRQRTGQISKLPAGRIPLNRPA